MIERRSNVTERQAVSRSRQGFTRERQTAIPKESEDFAQRESALQERDRSPIIDDISRRRKGYQYYFDK